MGLFDSYEPVPPLDCPVCGSPLDGWQGKDVPCALFFWRQGETAPVDQDVPDELKGDFSKARLPADFEIRTPCCGGRFFVTAHCTAPSGAWLDCTLETAENATQRQEERRADFKQRQAWLAGRSSDRKNRW